MFIFLKKSSGWPWVVVVGILIYILVLGSVASLRHYRFYTQTWDLGIFEQIMWNTTHGRIMQSSIEEVTHHFGVHFSPILFLIVPLFALWQSPYNLLFLQTAALALGAWPLYLLSKKILESERSAAVIALVYLLYPALHAVNLFDWHPVAFFIPLSLASLYFIETEKTWLSAASLAFTASVQEDAAIAVCFLALFWFLKKRPWARDRKTALIALVLSLIYALLAVKIFMPQFGGGLLRLDRYSALGASAPEIAQTLFTRPAQVWAVAATGAKLKYLFWLFLPVIFLPVMAPRSWIILAPGILENLLTTYNFQFSGQFQYDSMVVGPLLAASVYGLKNLQKWWPNKFKFVLCAVFLASLSLFFWRSPLSPLNFPNGLFRDNLPAKVWRRVVSAIPAEVSVAAPTTVVPHLANRPRVGMNGYERGPADVVLIDGQDSFGFPDAAAFQKYYDDYMAMGFYEPIVIDERFIVLKRRGIEIQL